MYSTIRRYNQGCVFEYEPRIVFNFSDRNVALLKNIAKVVIDYIYTAFGGLSAPLLVRTDLKPSRNRVVVPARRQATLADGTISLESIPGLLKSLRISSLECFEISDPVRLWILWASSEGISGGS
jgi:hypothetical protein